MSEPADHDDASGREEPLEGLAEEVARRRASSEVEDLMASIGFPDEFEVGEQFSEEPFEAVDALWDSIDVDGGTIGADGASGTTVVSKRDFCERCEFFSEPPEALCTHSGTEIVEFVDRERVRVRRCPVVARRRASQQLHRNG